jgi:hypothetical protein
VCAIDAEMVLVAEHRHGDLRPLALGAPRRSRLFGALECPAAVAVDLPRPRLRPPGRRATVAQRRLLVLGQSRPARLDHRRIHNLSPHRQIAAFIQQLVEAVEQLRQCPAARQLLAEQPDRLGVGNGMVQRKPGEAHEREPVAELIFDLVAESV